MIMFWISKFIAEVLLFVFAVIVCILIGLWVGRR